MTEFDKEGTGGPRLTKEEYVRLEIIKAVAGRIPWPPNESIKGNIDFMVNLVPYPGN
jgi:hypothetical protein